VKDQDRLAKKNPQDRIKIKEPEEDSALVSKKLSMYEVESPSKLKPAQQSNFLTIPTQPGLIRPKSPSLSPTKARSSGSSR